MHVNTLHKHRNMMKVSQKVQISFLVQYFVLANLKSRIQIGSKPDWIHKQDPWPKECPHGLKMNISPIQVWHMPPLVCVYSQESDIEKYFFFVPGDLWGPPPLPKTDWISIFVLSLQAIFSYSRDCSNILSTTTCIS